MILTLEFNYIVAVPKANHSIANHWPKSAVQRAICTAHCLRG
jgi:hypothetical protein